MKSRAFQTWIAWAWLGTATFVGVRAAADEAAPTAAGDQPAKSSAAVDAPPVPPEIAKWIAELDDNRYLVREEATRRLLAAGATALDPLLAAANGNRPEPADRAIWVLQKIGRSEDPSAARAALVRLVQLRERPNIVMAARVELVRVGFLTCKRRLESLGAEVASVMVTLPSTGVPASGIQVQLGEKWRGKAEDLNILVDDAYHQHYQLMGQGVDDAAVKVLEAKQDLACLQLFNTKVTAAAVESLKTRLPNTEVLVRGSALLGLAAKNRGAGLVVEMVQGGTGAAAAGIREGDVLLTLDGHSLPDFDRMTAYISEHKPGEKIQLEVQRGNDKLHLEATLGSWAGQPQ